MEHRAVAGFFVVFAPLVLAGEHFDVLRLQWPNFWPAIPNPARSRRGAVPT